MSTADQSQGQQGSPDSGGGDVLPASEEWLRLILDSAKEYAIFTTDPELAVTTWNPGAERILGYSDQEIIGHDSRKVFTPEDQAAKVPEQEREFALTHGRAEDERWHMRKDGSRFWASGVAMPLRGKDGAVHGILKILRDLTERKNAENALKESEVRLREAHDVLEQRVRERTEQLEHANAQLQEENRERKRLERIALEVSEREQRRMGQDLHDTLCQELAGFSLMAKAMARRLADKDSKEAQQAVQLGDLLNRAVSSARNIARGLHPVEFERGGLVAALKDLAESVTVSVSCHFDPPELIRISDPVVALHLYRIAQEAVTNAVKHAQAQAIEINLRREEDIVLTVKDNGCGFDPQEMRKRSMGMELMRYRASVIGARLAVSSAPERETVVECRLPLATGGSSPSV